MTDQFDGLRAMISGVPPVQPRPIPPILDAMRILFDQIREQGEIPLEPMLVSIEEAEYIDAHGGLTAVCERGMAALLERCNEGRDE